MTTRETYRSYVQYGVEDLTQETVYSGAPWQFSDDFVGAGHGAGVPAAGSPSAGYPWVKKIVGAGPPTVGIPAGVVSGGLMACTLLSTSEAEEASLYFNDSLQIDTTRNGCWEWRSLLSVAPSAAGVQAFLGLGTAWVGGPLNLARYMGFLWNGSGALSVVAKDGAGNTESIAAAPIGGSAITTDTTTQHYYRISWENQADIAFFVDGNRVNAVGSVPWAPTGTNGVFQPWHTVYKPSGTGVATLTMDKTEGFNGR